MADSTIKIRSESEIKPDCTWVEFPAVVDGRYELQRPIARGGMGTVFMAFDLQLKRYVAIKRIRPGIAADPALRGMFRREAEAMAHLHHPNVVAIHDMGGWDGLPYLVMPYHQSQDLTRWAAAQDGPPLAVQTALEPLVQICRGLGAMHRAGLIHGDIKPSNILMTDAGEVILVDLGLARAMRVHDDPKLVRGTPGYIPPEILRGEVPAAHLAPMIDMYALGVTADWLLTGRAPPSPWELLDGMPRAPIDQIRPDVPSSLAEVVMAAMDPVPQQRASLELFHAMLERARDAGGLRSAPSIVVLDDDPIALALTEALVQDTVADARITCLCDSRAALSIIASRPPDLVVTDLQMPGLNGLELTAALRAHEETASVPVVVLTAVGGASDWQHLHRLGADCLVPKPINPGVFGDALRRILQAPPRRTARPGRSKEVSAVM